MEDGLRSPAWEGKSPLPPGKYHRLFQVVGTVERANGEDPLADSREVALNWVRTKKGWKITSDDAVAGRPIHLEDEHSLRTLSVESSPGLWAIRLDDPCREVVGRQWRVELVLMDQGVGRPAFGCTLSVMVPLGSTDHPTPGIPGVINELARTQGLEEAGHRLNGQLWEIERPHEVDDLISYMESINSPVSILLVSRPRQGRPFTDPKVLAQKLAGVAVVAACTPEAAQELTQRYGRDLGVFGDALRLYRVGFDADVDTKWQHPLFLSHWKSRIGYMSKQLKSIAMMDTVRRRDESRDVPNFGLIRQISAERRLTSVFANATEEAPAMATLREEVAKLQADRDEWKAMALDEERSANEAKEGQQQTKARLYLYGERIRALEVRLQESGQAVNDSFPSSLEDLGQWAESNLAGRLVLTPRALRSASRSEHAEPEKIFQALSLLAGEYWTMKVGGGGTTAKSSFDLASAEVGFRVAPTGMAVRQRQFEDEYHVLWEGKRYPLDLHLSGSDSRDVRRGLRVYFSWDQDQELVIVGHLPTHLTNTLT